MITAVWRCCGTIAFVVYFTVVLCTPSLVVLASLSNSMGAPAALTEGAILAGVYFGDRCSPMSSSATLVSELTGTNIFENIRAMVKTALVPFVLSCVVYLLLGFTFKASLSSSSVRDIFLDNYALPVITVLPAVLIILLSLFRLNVKLVMACSIVSGVLILVFVQGMDIWETLGIMLTAQLCEHLEADGSALAIDLENSVVVLSAFIPGPYPLRSPPALWTRLSAVCLSPVTCGCCLCSISYSAKYVPGKSLLPVLKNKIAGRSCGPPGRFLSLIPRWAAPAAPPERRLPLLGLWKHGRNCAPGAGLQHSA